jgi:L-ribulose-5-phosphate 3-epimerase UlaE
MSPISASDLMMTLSRDVRYPFGSTDVAVPEVAADIFDSNTLIQDGIDSSRGTNLIELE